MKYILLNWLIMFVWLTSVDASLSDFETWITFVAFAVFNIAGFIEGSTQ